MVWFTPKIAGEKPGSFAGEVGQLLLDVQPVQAMHQQPGLSQPDQRAGQAVVIGVEVGDDQPADVFEASPQLGHLARECLQDVWQVPATVDQGPPIVATDQIAIGVPQGAASQR